MKGKPVISIVVPAFHEHKRTLLHLLLLTAVGCLVFFFNLGGPRLWDRDEPRNAACAREMLERDDWVVPTFNGELRVLKPAMKYWLMMSAYKIFGVNEFAARFWSAVFALATVLATYVTARRLFNAHAGLWSALILATSLLFVAAGHLAKIDAPLTFFSTLAVLIFVWSAFKPATKPAGESEPIAAAALTTPIPQSWFIWILIYAAVGLAALAKGLPGLLLPPAVIGMFLLIARLPESPTNHGSTTWRRRLLGILRPFAPGHFLRIFWSMRPLTAVVVTLAVAGPWYVLVGLRTDGEFLRGFFLEHHLGRAMQPMEDHSGPFLLYYMGAIAVGFFPWSVFLPALLVWLVAQFRSDHPWRFSYLLAACWVGVYVFIFSCARTKLPSYITPCFPGLALLMGAFVHNLATGLQARPAPWIRPGLVLLAVTGVALAIGSVIAARRWMPGQELLGLIGLILVVGAVVAYVLLERRRNLAASITLVVAAVAFSTTLFGIGLARVGRQEAQQSVCAAFRKHGDHPSIGMFGSLEPSWVFYANHPLQPLSLVDESSSEDYRWKVKPVPAATFFGQDPDHLILTTDVDWQWLRPTLPADAVVLSQAPRTPRRGSWLLIGHAPLAPNSH